MDSYFINGILVIKTFKVPYLKKLIEVDKKNDSLNMEIVN